MHQLPARAAPPEWHWEYSDVRASGERDGGAGAGSLLPPPPPCRFVASPNSELMVVCSENAPKPTAPGSFSYMEKQLYTASSARRGVGVLSCSC